VALLSAKAPTAHKRSTKNNQPPAWVAYVIVMNLGLFAPVADVRHGVDELVRLGMEQMIPLRGYDEVTLPGTPEYRSPVAGLITNQ
jgi:hypothetical protein